MRGGEVAISAFLTRLPDPGHAVHLQDCKVSTFGRALHTAWTKCRQRGGQLQGIGGSLLRSPSRAVSPRCTGAHAWYAGQLAINAILAC